MMHPILLRWRPRWTLWAVILFIFASIPASSTYFPVFAYRSSAEAPTVIRGFVWQDDNRNGILDPGEPRLASVVIYLEDQGRNVLSQTQTFADGSYQFMNLAPGRYIVRIAMPAGMVSVTGDEVACDIAAGQIRIVNFGVTPALTPTGITPTPTSPSPLPTPTPTATATPTPTFTPTPSPTPTPTVPLGLFCDDVIRNGSFEGVGEWELPKTHLQGAIVDVRAFPLDEEGHPKGAPQDGNLALRLGVIEPLDPPSYSSARQMITIPANATSARLTFYVWTFSQDQDGGDRQEAYLLDSRTLRIRSRLWRNDPAKNDEKWERVSRDLLPYRGGTYILYFNAYNDGDDKVTALFVDNVSLDVCERRPVTPTPTPTEVVMEAEGVVKASPVVTGTPAATPSITPEKKQQEGKEGKEGEQGVSGIPGRIRGAVENALSGAQRIFLYLLFFALLLLVIALVLIRILGGQGSPPSGP